MSPDPTTTDPPTAEQDGSASARVLAYLDDHRARYPYEAKGVVADLPAAYDNGPLPYHELLEIDLRAVLAENARMRRELAAAIDGNQRLQTMNEGLRQLAECEGCGCCTRAGCHRGADATCPTNSVGDSVCPCTED